MERNLILKLPVKERIKLAFNLSVLYLSTILTFFGFYTMQKEGLESSAYISIGVAMLFVVIIYLWFKSSLEAEIRQNEHNNILNKSDDVEEKRESQHNQVKIDLQNQIIDLQKKLIDQQYEVMNLHNENRILNLHTQNKNTASKEDQ